ncbi:histidine kinase [Embleya sp. NPDC056575]|uniref:histidine kinase n=1 Tax=unclassified Embleya TaxID=2699296 RepID=UPI0036853E09
MGFGPESWAALGRAVTGRDLAGTTSTPGAPPGRWAFLGVTRADLVICLVAAAVDTFGFFITLPSAGPGERVVGTLFMLVSAASLLARRRSPIGVLSFVLTLVVVLNLLLAMPQRFGIALAVALYTVGLAGRARTVALAALATLAAQATGYPNASQSFLWLFSGDFVAVLLVIGVSVAVRNWQGQIEVNRVLLADRALSDERRRIARELHDIVAHHITTMHLMSGGARASLDRDPEAARAALLTLEASGRVALGEMRQLLGVLRSDHDPDQAASVAPQPGVDDLARLIAESCLAGLPTELRVLGAPRALPLPVGLAVYRITQEALTNARKHAGDGATATVRLEYLPGAVAVEIRDDGGGEVVVGDHAMTGGGHGLVGMRERVAVHGGSFEAGRVADGGFRVAAVLPLAGEEPAPAPTPPAGVGPASEPDRLARLGPAELALLRLFATGKADREIAAAIRVEPAGLERREADLLTKLDVRDRAQAVVVAYESGLVRAGQGDRDR